MPDESDTAEKVKPILVSVKDAAKLLGVTPWSVYRLLDDKEITEATLRGRRLVVLASLEEYVEKITGKSA